MKITDVSCRLLSVNRTMQWWESSGPIPINHMLVTVDTDEGIQGNLITWVAQVPEMRGAIPALRAQLKGRDPHHVEAIWQELTGKGQRPSASQSTLDICLWDILGKYHKVPVYKLLGAARDRIRAYASTIYYPKDQDYVDLALKLRSEGFNALKLHAYAIPQKDIRVCKLVREAVGDTMDLMLDPVNQYDRKGAFEVGRALEKLGFYWFEAPIPDTDLQGLADLTRSLDIQVTATESVFGGFMHYAPFLRDHVVDGVRTVGDWAGGITGMRKTAALCEAFGVKYEPHHYGPPLVVAAHLHVSLACANCDFVEIPVPQGILDFGMKDIIRVEKDGCVSGPKKPGLGYEIDWAWVEKNTVEKW